jgi:GAF domain-containing protein
MSSDDWARSLKQAAQELQSQPQRICELCVELLPVSGAGISMVTQAGNRGIVCATDDVAARIEELQFSLGEGPCVDAVHSGGPVLIPDLERPSSVTVERWPAFMAAAAEAGIRGVFAFPLLIGAIRIGALDLYRMSPGELTDDQLTGALLAADAAALALLYLHTDAADGFIDDPGSRAGYHLDVHQATGMVQAQLDVSTEEAFLRLRARAFADGRSVTEVSADVINRRLQFDVEDQ